MIILRFIFPGTNLLPCSYFQRISSSLSQSHLNVRRVTDSERSLLEQKYNPPVYLCFLSLDFFFIYSPTSAKPLCQPTHTRNRIPLLRILMLYTNIHRIRIHNLIINTPISQHLYYLPLFHQTCVHTSIHR